MEPPENFFGSPILVKEISIYMSFSIFSLSTTLFSQQRGPCSKNTNAGIKTFYTWVTFTNGCQPLLVCISSDS